MKRTMKRIALLLTVMCLALSLIPCVSAKHFYDVPSSIGEVYLDAINYVSDNGIMGGTGVNQFSPEAAVSRGMMVMILYRLSGDTHTYYNANKFIDVPSNSYYYNAIGWAVANGIAGGTSENTFEPEKSILREQLMTMLYRFAGYLSLPQDTDEDLRRASDYSSLSSYAYTPMSWAYEYGIVARGSLTERIWPISVETRKNTALYIARFLHNVEGIVCSRDGFSFDNSGTYFLSDSKGKKLISQEDWLRFYNVAVSQGCDYDNLHSYATQKWGGACYGMSVAVLLDYCGKIDFNGNYCNNVATMYEIPSLKQVNSTMHQKTTYFENSSIIFTNAESKINLLQMSVHIPSINQWINTGEAYANTQLRNMVAQLEHSGMGVLSYVAYRSSSNDPIYHAVIAYGKPKVTTTGYEISLYDPNVPRATRTLKITTKASGWTGTIEDNTAVTTISRCIFRTDFSSYYGILDIDGYDNTTVAGTQNLLDDYVMLSVRTSGDFTFTNSEGEYFTFSTAISPTDADSQNSSVLGELNVENKEMQVYGMSFVPEGDTCTVFILTNPSESFSCTPAVDREVSNFSANGCGLSFSNVTGESAGILTICAEDAEIS